MHFLILSFKKNDPKFEKTWDHRIPVWNGSESHFNLVLANSFFFGDLNRYTGWCQNDFDLRFCSYRFLSWSWFKVLRVNSEVVHHRTNVEE